MYLGIYLSQYWTSDHATSGTSYFFDPPVNSLNGSEAKFLISRGPIVNWGQTYSKQFYGCNWAHFPGRKNLLRLWLQHLMEKGANRETKGQCIGTLTTGYACNCNAKEITILFCKQIGQIPNTSYAKCRMGLREGKMEIAGNSFSSRPIFVS